MNNLCNVFFQFQFYSDIHNVMLYFVMMKYYLVDFSIYIEIVSTISGQILKEFIKLISRPEVI